MEDYEEDDYTEVMKELGYSESDPDYFIDCCSLKNLVVISHLQAARATRVWAARTPGEQGLAIVLAEKRKAEQVVAAVMAPQPKAMAARWRSPNAWE